MTNNFDNWKILNGKLLTDKQQDEYLKIINKVVKMDAKEYYVYRKKLLKSKWSSNIKLIDTEFAFRKLMVTTDV